MHPSLVTKLVDLLVASVRAGREAAGMSRRELAAKAGINPATITLIEQGKRSPTLVTLLLLAEALEMNLSTTIADACSKLGMRIK